MSASVKFSARSSARTCPVEFCEPRLSFSGDVGRDLGVVGVGIELCVLLPSTRIRLTTRLADSI